MFQSKTISSFALLALSALCPGWGNPDSNFKVKRGLPNVAPNLERRAAHPVEIVQPQNNDPNVPDYIGAIPPVPDAKNEVDDAVEAQRHDYSPDEDAPILNAGAPPPEANPPDEEGLPPMTEGTPLKNIPTGTVNETGLVGSYTTPGVAVPTTTEGANFSISVSTSGTVEISVTVSVNTTGTRPFVATATGTAGNRTSHGIPSEKMIGASNNLWIVFGTLWMGLGAGAGLFW
ncbi:uncharacterized protein J3D65DRAFT_690473 [Phyllosticta citribraziliensis]|uniref:Uncharacterized protein n=1 Tax=Phyllosticta citribraziliensis TaxID=989973 RepID=A0ABR1M492_9PEZI